MLLISQKFLEERQDTPPPVQGKLKCKVHSFDKYAQLLLFQDPHLSSEKNKENPLPHLYLKVVAHQEIAST